MKRILVIGFIFLAAVSCSRNRYDFVDIAASERTFEMLREGFQGVSTAEGRWMFLRSMGVPVADVLVVGETPGQPLPDVPSGYNAAPISRSTLLESLHVKHNRLYTDEGLNGRVLFLQEGGMSLEMLTALASLADEGAFIGGAKPSSCLDPKDEEAFRHIADKVWMNGNVQSGRTLRSILRAAGVKPDVKSRSDSLAFHHRHLPHAEIYGIRNFGTDRGPVKLRFRVVGRQPYLWNPDTGEISPVRYAIRKRSTKVWLPMVPSDETFVVFCTYADRKKLKIK